MSPILNIQRRMMELGRVRLGEKGKKGEPVKRETFRFTTASESLAKDVSRVYGGDAQPWPDAPDGDGYWQVSSEATELRIILPPVFSDDDGSPTVPYSQWYEHWTAAGCQRRCDAVTESISGKACICQVKIAKDGEDARLCKVTTRVSFMLPDVVGLGVWRLDSHGWNAATELPGTLDLLVRAAASHTFLEASIRIEPRTKKVAGEGTRRFVVPVLDLPNFALAELVDVTSRRLSLNPPAATGGAKPDLPGDEPPEEVEGTVVEPNDVDFGDSPDLTPDLDATDWDEKAAELLAVSDVLGVNLKTVSDLIEKRKGDLDWIDRQIIEGHAAVEMRENASKDSVFKEKGAEMEKLARKRAERSGK